jgi:hypothetical protein
MKGKIKETLNTLIGFRGLKLIKKYEIDHLQNKYIESIEQIESYFLEKIFKDVKVDAFERKLLSQMYGTSISEAFYIIHYLRNSLKLPGDVCEFGVGNGATSALLGHEINKTDKKLFLFDSFKGLSKPTPEDRLLNDIFGLGSMHKYESTMAYAQKEVLEKIALIKFPKSRLKIVAGFIEKTISSNKVPKKVCFSYVDLDLYSPIKTALMFLDKVLISGGYIIVDDYNYFSAGAKKAVDEFIVKRKNKYDLILPYKFSGHFCILRKK